MLYAGHSAQFSQPSAAAYPQRPSHTLAGRSAFPDLPDHAADSPIGHEPSPSARESGSTTSEREAAMTRDEHAELLHLLCEDAKAISRRGFMGLRCAEYAALHQQINDELEALGV